MNHERVDEELYQDFETGDAKKAGPWAQLSVEQLRAADGAQATGASMVKGLQPDLGQLGACLKQPSLSAVLELCERRRGQGMPSLLSTEQQPGPAWGRHAADA